MSPKQSPTRCSRSRAGYAVGLVRDDDTIEVRDPKLIRIGEMLPSEEIDLSADAALLEADYAQRALEEARAPSDSNGRAAAGDGNVRGRRARHEERGPARRGDETGGIVTSGSVDTVGRVELKATVGKTGFFDLNRALSWLRDNASDVHVRDQDRRGST